MIQELFDKGRFQEVIDYFSNLEPKDEREYLILALSFYNLGRKNKAIAMLNRMLKIYPNNMDALFNLAIIHYQLRNWNKVKEIGEKFYNIESSSWEINDILSDLYVFEGNFEKALTHMKTALENVPSELLSELKVKFQLLKEKIQISINKKKIAFICAAGLDNFINDIIEGLSDGYWVRKFTVTSDKEIYEAIDWADIVWFEWANEVAIIGTNYPGIVGKKVIVRLHSYEVLCDLPKKIKWDVVDKLVFVAPHIKNIFFNEFSKFVGDISSEIVYNGIDLDKFTFKERKPGYNIAWVAHINYKKNPSMMLQIIRKLYEIDPNYKLHVAGDFQDKRYEYYFKYMVKEMGLENNVIFYGWVDDIDEWLEDKNYLLSTSIHESFGYSIMEAMAKGIKPVIHNFYGARELYDLSLICSTIDEFVGKIVDNEYNSKFFRIFVEKFSLRKQIENIKNVIADLIK